MKPYFIFTMLCHITILSINLLLIFEENDAAGNIILG